MSNNDAFPPLDDLSTFLAVRRAGGFRAASRWLGVSPSTVSETVSRLEARLGVPLFIRTTRSVQVTEAGRALYDRLEPVVREARAALDDASSTRESIRGLIKLNVPGAVMVDILPPLMERFLAAHPAVRMEIMVDDRMVDVIAAGCDAGIRYGEHLAQDVIAVPIGPRRQRGALAASPDYLRRRGVPAHPRDLVLHDCIRSRFSSGALIGWELEREGELLTVDPLARVIVSTAASGTAIDLALAGLGIIATFDNWLEPHLGRGSLVPVLPDWWPGFEGPWLYFSSRSISTPLRAFVDFVAGARADSAAAPE